MPLYKVTREFLGYEEAVIEATSEENARDLIDEAWFDFEPEVVDSYNYTGNDDVEEVDE